MKVLSAVPTAEAAIAGKTKRGLERKDRTEAEIAEPMVTRVQICQIQTAEDNMPRSIVHVHVEQSPASIWNRKVRACLSLALASGDLSICRMPS